MDALKDKAAQRFELFVEQLFEQGQYPLLILIGVALCLYFLRNEIPKLISWVSSRRLSKIKGMLDSGWLDTEMSIDLQEQFNQVCFQKTRKFSADKNLRVKIFSLLEQDASLSMISFRRAREYYCFRNGIFTFKITSRHYVYASIIILAAILLSSIWLLLYFLIFTDTTVSALQWLLRIAVLFLFGLFCGILFGEISKFSGARKLNLKLNNQIMPSIPKFWLNQLNKVLNFLKYKK